MKTKISFKRYCKDVANEIRLLIDAKVVMNNLEDYWKNKNLIVQTTKKDYQTITVHKDYVPNVYFTIRIIKEDQFLVCKYSSSFVTKKSKKTIKVSFSSIDKVKDFFNEVL